MDQDTTPVDQDTTPAAVPPAEGAATPHRAGRVARRVRQALRGHRLLSVLLLLGLVLRVLAWVAYRPALIYVDSVASYLNPLPTLDPTGPDPIGYVIVLLRPLLAVGGLPLVTAVQHLMGLAMGAVIYVVLVRRGARRWLAALAAVPVLLDAYQVQIEQNIMSDTTFQAVLVTALAVLVWPRRPGWRRVALAGLLLGTAVTVRLAGEPLILAAVLYVLITARHWRRRLVLVAVLAAGFAVPVAGYASFYHHSTGRYALGASGGEALYGRTATFVDCSGLRLPSYERVLCPTFPPDLRPGVDYWAHDPTSPRFKVVPPPNRTTDDVLTDFAIRAIRHQPLEFARAVAADSVKAFTWQHQDHNQLAPVERWRFQTSFPTFPSLVTLDAVDQLGRQYGGGSHVVVAPLAAGLRWYQLHLGYTPGPVMAAFLVLALVGALRPRRGHPAAARTTCVLYLAAGALALLFADAFEFSWRYQLPGLVLLPVAGVLGLTALLRPAGVPAVSGGRPGGGDFPSTEDTAALAGFAATYGSPALPPVVVVIAAYHEQAELGAVLDAVPATCHGLDVATIVVVDGGTDATAEVARRHGAYTCAVPVNRGQGAALRLGYHLARTGGARYIVTTDADGQYNLAEMPLLLAPLLDGTADFTTGSRRLGRDESTDRVRRAGVRVFAWLVSVLTGHRVTDTSFGFRAMRAEITGRVTLRQPQYQSSELLVGVLSHGWRVRELPMTMHRRTGGRSKKGGNLTYGARYARVVVTTWLRERPGRRPAATAQPPAGLAPADTAEPSRR